MIKNASFQRKVVYLGLIALLLIPLYMIGHPATGNQNDASSSRGGQLAQLRMEHNLAPIGLGEIDPASESMKLATLGLKGVAANILLLKANHYKKTEEWEKLMAATNQLVKLQPHFVKVWEYQSHNLSYNISVEHDDYKFRYLWVKKGIEFLTNGVRYNRHEPKMPWTVGWYIGQKIGRADEHRQFRRLFKSDEDFHTVLSRYVPIDTEARGADQLPDNWLASKLWYDSAYNIVETGQAPIRGKAPHIFYSDGPKALMNYATTIEAEGVLDEKAQYAWRRAGDEWNEYGNRVVPTSWGIRIRLNDKEAVLADAQRISDELDKLLPGLREKIRDDKIAALPEGERVAFKKDWSEIKNQIEGMRKIEAEGKVEVSYRDVANASPSSVRARAFSLAKQAQTKETEAQRIDSYRNNVNFNYWKARCAVEQLPATVNARRHIFKAKEHMEAAELDSAKDEFELAWTDWAATFTEHQALVNELTSDDLEEDIQTYIHLLGQLDEELPENFALQAILDKFAPMHQLENGVEEGDDAEMTDADPVAPETAESSSSDSDEQPANDPESSEAAESEKDEPASPAKEDEAPKADDPAEEPSAPEPPAEATPADQPNEQPATSDAPAAPEPEANGEES